MNLGLEMKGLIAVGLAVFALGCGNWSYPSNDPITFRLPGVYVDDDSPAFAPTMCFIGLNSDEILIGEVVRTSEVFVPEIQCDAAQQKLQRPYQIIELKTEDGRSRTVVAEVMLQPHNDLVPAQQVMMGVMASADTLFLNAYFLIDDAEDGDSTPGMPSTLSELIQVSKSQDCGERTVLWETVAQEMFSPPVGSCNSPGL